ncbi:MAG: tRNA (adenosine(37)-N6)-dimethylallyltransferase MiaA [Tannerellaceae bacterium]|jgi:tRNA dimethylallyltransferase|nr:tRNA (adenosine(37)-N6)-dimethylallyltransferase MiaA [Tannerellaceae bacterium]
MKTSDTLPLLTVLGPTASGKTSFAVALALTLDAEIISGDSRQVYRRMDIGTGKDRDQYSAGNRTVPCHLIDICEPGYKYSVYEYQRDFHAARDSIRGRGRRAVLCGGSGMYIEAALKGYRMPDVPPNPALRQDLAGRPVQELTAILAGYGNLHNTTDLDSTQRLIRAIEIRQYCAGEMPVRNLYPPVQGPVIGIDVDRETRRSKISSRLRNRLDEGMLDEVRSLLDEGITPEELIYYGLEYKYLTLHLTGRMPYDEMFSQLEIAIHQFAKRQMTWFRGMERRGIVINWIPASLTDDEKVAAALSLPGISPKQRNTI